VAANLKAAAANISGVYNVCTGKATDFNRIIALLNEVLGLRLEPEYFDNPYTFYQSQTLGDPSAAQQALNFSSQFSVEQGIQEYLGGQKQKVLVNT
jgi:ADP-L-glycero-D-manno-heptose 6-epimerase